MVKRKKERGLRFFSQRARKKNKNDEILSTISSIESKLDLIVKNQSNDDWFLLKKWKEYFVSAIVGMFIQYIFTILNWKIILDFLDGTFMYFNNLIVNFLI